MAAHYLMLPGLVVAVEALRVPKARAVARYLERGDRTFARLVTTLRDESTSREIIVMDVDVQRPQRVVHPIRYVERIAVRFSSEDETWPEVFALRDGFPRVPHLNLTVEEFPRSLCLYDTPYDEVKLRWTAPAYVERIRQWLAETAMGTLHAPDQPLEPLLLGYAPHLIVPECLVTADDDTQGGLAQEHASAVPTTPRLYPITRCDAGNGRTVFSLTYTHAPAPAAEGGAVTSEIAALVLRGASQTHGVIARQPTTLRALHDVLLPAEIDLLQAVRDSLLRWRRTAAALRAHLIVVVVLPKRRTDAGPPEATDIWAFYVVPGIEQLGEEIGIWRSGAGVILDPSTRVRAPLVHTRPDLARDGAATGIMMLNPSFALSREQAARLNGAQSMSAPRVVAIGMGALGSHVFANLVRAGYGAWTTVDSDYVLPHNQARFAIFGDFGVVGRPKASLMAACANSIFDDPSPIAQGIVADVLHPGEHAAELDEVYAAAEVILDMSASGAVARFLARDVASPARRASFFVTPTGTDAVLLVEDISREIPLDVLEMQYYRYLLHHPAWHDHLAAMPTRLRYARSCRDISSELPHELISLHAANGSRALRTALEQQGTNAQLWHAEPNGSVRTAQIELAPVVSVHSMQTQAGWTIMTDAWFLEQVRATRARSLPKETGGILIGAWDMQRRILYVVDTLPSPSDSVEELGGYVRGRDDMSESLARVECTTGGMLEYVGEWHSHPPGHGSLPSQTDCGAFSNLRALRRADGFPMLMLIVGQTPQMTWLLDVAEDEKQAAF